ncbi:MAG: glycosyltransferase family 2 protein [Candidatus Pacebacteria bacterium]|nr:glycosyltransferase family 2 protein [Candidatus Paceibacterota bacterium]
MWRVISCHCEKAEERSERNADEAIPELCTENLILGLLRRLLFATLIRAPRNDINFIFMNFQKKVHIILLNWNGKEDTLECIESLQKVEYSNYKIIIVDNNSEDDSVLAVRKKYPEIKIIENEKNLGFAGGNNVGIKYAIENDADYVLLINNDTTVEKDFLRELVEEGESNKNNGLLGPKTNYHSEPNRIWFAGGKVSWLKNKGTHLGLDEIDNGQYNEIKEVDYLTGCCLLIKREVIQKIGILAEDYFLYYEDTDFSLRAKNVGYKCVYVPKAKIYHKVSRSTKPGSPSYIYYHVRNGFVMTKRNGSLLNKIVLCFYCVFLFLKQIIKIIFMPKRRGWSFAVLKGEKDFLLGKMGKVE